MGTTSWKLVLAAALLMSVPFAAAIGAGSPTDEECAKMREATPENPRVKPEKPRRLLVFNRSHGYVHSAIPYGARAIQILGQETGAFETVVTSDLTYFRKDQLDQFDAVFLNNTNNEIFLPPSAELKKMSAEEKKRAERRGTRLRSNLKEFLASGKGLAAIHAAVASFREWPEFGKIIGARFCCHPWHAGSTVTLKVDDPDHPVARAFEGGDFTVSDEIYQVVDPYSREKLRVLVSIDTDETKMPDHPKLREDRDFAMSWVKSYGDGRVFYCALGHQKPVFWDPVILQHWLDGIQFVLGDLEADTTPSAKIEE